MTGPIPSADAEREAVGPGDDATFAEPTPPNARAARLVEALLAARTAGFRLASPLEALARRLRGHEALPPLWLRRHTGAPSQFRRAARSTIELLDGLELIPTSGNVLDVGCGCGALAFEFERRPGWRGRYLGFDVHGPSIHWCRRRFASDDRLRFELAAVDSPYTRGAGAGRQPIGAFRFPAESGSADLVVAKSLFTHLATRELLHYLGEIRRVLAPGGAVFATFFLFAPNGPTPIFPYPASTTSPVRWRRKYRPHAAIAYQRRYLEGTLSSLGFRIDHLVEGFYPGDGEVIRGQDQLILST